MEAGGVSSQDLYVKRQYNIPPATHFHVVHFYLWVTGTQFLSLCVKCIQIEGRHEDFKIADGKHVYSFSILL